MKKVKIENQIKNISEKSIEPQKWDLKFILELYIILRDAGVMEW